MTAPVLQGNGGLAAHTNTCNNASGVTASDYVLLYYTWADTSASPGNATFPSGFVQRGATQDANVGGGFFVHRAYADSNGTDQSAASTFTMTPPGSTVDSGCIAFRISGTAGWDATAGIASASILTANSTPLAMPAITTTNPDELVLIVDQHTSGITQGTPSGYTDQATGTGDFNAWWKNMSSAGSTGTPTSTPSGSRQEFDLIIAYIPKYAGSLSQSFGFQQTLTGLSTKNGSLAQSFGFQQLLTGLSTVQGSLSQSFGFQQLLTGVATFPGILSQGFGFQQAISGVVSFNGTLSQAIGFLQQLGGLSTKDGILGQSFGFSQALNAGSVVNGSMSQSFGFAQALAGNIIFQGTLTQAIGFLQSLQGVDVVNGTMTQVFGFAQMLTGDGGLPVGSPVDRIWVGIGIRIH